MFANVAIVVFGALRVKRCRRLMFMLLTAMILSLLHAFLSSTDVFQN